MNPALPKPALSVIITAARAGSLNYAASLFDAGGWAARSADPAALATKARLLRDQALRATGPERPRLLGAAADAYGAADTLWPQLYTRINEASLRFLSGDRDAACTIARDLLDWMATGTAFNETPYFIAATQAEAYLLCGNLAAAAQALRNACLADPDGWSDRASTLRQCALILAEPEPTPGWGLAWLDEFRPPCSLNFAGHLGVSSAQSEELRSRIAAWMAAHTIGFGFGALAAGADITIAEALLARGGELHVILPIGIEAFIAQSVAPYGSDWRDRFAACLDAAGTVQCVTSLSGAYEPLATQLAADVAMGAAALNASSLQGDARQLLVIDDGPGRFGAGLGTQRIGERWRGEQHCLIVPRDAPVPASGLRTQPEGRADRRLAAMLMIAFDGLDHCDETCFTVALDTVIGPFRDASAKLPVQPDLTLPMGNARLVVFADPDAAWAYAKALLALPAAALPLRLAGHYAIAHWLDDPAALVGRGTADLAAIAAAALPGVLTASETLAAALFVNLADQMVAEHVGEVGDIKLFALNPGKAP